MKSVYFSLFTILFAFQLNSIATSLDDQTKKSKECSKECRWYWTHIDNKCVEGYVEGRSFVGNDPYFPYKDCFKK